MSIYMHICMHVFMSMQMIPKTSLEQFISNQTLAISTFCHDGTKNSANNAFKIETEQTITISEDVQM